MLARMWRIVTFVHCWGEIKNGAAIMENSTKFPQKIKNETTYDPAIPFPEIDLNVLKSGSQRDISTLMFIVALTTMVKMWKQCRCSLMDGQIKKILLISASAALSLVGLQVRELSPHVVHKHFTNYMIGASRVVQHDCFGHTGEILSKYLLKVWRKEGRET